MKFVLFLFAVIHYTMTLRVTTFYESLSRESFKFITRQLVPVYKKYHMYGLQLSFIPYGFANTSIINGTYTFKCEHRIAECNLNKIHACIANSTILTDAIKLEKIACFMNKARFEKKYKKVIVQCTSSRSESKMRKALIHCFYKKADKILAYYGNVTVSKDITYLPSIYLNDKKPSIEQVYMTIYFSKLIKKIYEFS